jgi:hypothetical protein
VSGKKDSIAINITMVLQAASAAARQIFRIKK